MRWLLALALLAAAALAQEDGGLERRVEELERQLAEERARGAAREQRLRELETALEKATDALARAQDRRGLEREIESYLAERPPAAPAPPPSRLSIGAVLVSSYRFAERSGSGGDLNSFRLEERYLRVVYRFSDAVTARYYTDGSLAELEWIAHELLRINAGVVVVPFGQFNQRGFPDTFDTLSRPLLYLGDEDTFATPANNPRPVFRSLYSDTGVVVSGSHWRDGDQLYYAAFVTNGLTGINDLGSGAGFSDNNDDKQVGARVAYTVRSWFDRARLGAGLSALAGKYDAADRLSYRLYGADVVYVLDGLFRDAEGSLTVRAEYVYAPREILYPSSGDPAVLVNDAARVQGAYLLVEARLDRRWMVYAEGDWLQQRAPRIVGGTIGSSQTVTSSVWRFTFGVVHRFAIGIVWKAEYGYWDYDLGAPGAHTFATQLVIPF